MSKLELVRGSVNTMLWRDEELVIGLAIGVLVSREYGVTQSRWLAILNS